MASALPGHHGVPLLEDVRAGLLEQLPRRLVARGVVEPCAVTVALGQTAGVAEVGSRCRLALVLHRRGAQVDDKRVVHVVSAYSRFGNGFRCNDGGDCRSEQSCCVFHVAIVPNGLIELNPAKLGGIVTCRQFSSAGPEDSSCLSSTASACRRLRKAPRGACRGSG